MKDNKIVFGEKLQGIPYIASTNLGRPIDLEKAVNTIDNTMYEPEHFPALIYRMNQQELYRQPCNRLEL
jgi:TATA-box binding protein (TBP) (component of TFIID and TFIIIB)